MELKEPFRFIRPNRLLPWFASAVVVVAVGAVVGMTSAGLGSAALGDAGFGSLPALVAIGVLLIGASFVDMTVLPVLAVPATLVATRVGGVLSVSDLVLIGATFVALLMLRGRGARAIQPLLAAGGVYLALAIPTLILNPYGANFVEWFHEAFLVLGSIIVGFVVGREGKARISLSLYILACMGIGIAAAVTAVTGFAQTGAFQPVYLGELHKNAIGGMLAAAAVIVFANPVWLGWSRRWAYSAAVICSLGVLAAQSRQGLVAIMVGVLIITLRPLVIGRRRGRLIWLVYIPVIALILSELNQQLLSDDRFNSAHQRLTWFSDSIGIWQTSPVFGVGMRWWYTSRFGDGFQPPNAELEVLTTVGVVGLAAFLLMFLMAAWHLSRLDPMYGTVGLAVMGARFTQAQFDLFWVAGQASLFWIVAGMCFGVMVRDREAASAVVAKPALAVPRR